MTDTKPDMNKIWPMRGVSEDTKRLVRLYSVEYDITMAQALTELVTYAYEAHKKEQTQ